MKRWAVLIAGLLAVCGPALAQWSDPMDLPIDSSDYNYPVLTPVGDSEMIAAWTGINYSSGMHEVRGAHYSIDTHSWEGPIPFSVPSLVEAGPPGLTSDPVGHSILLAWYSGSFPVDGDTWGIMMCHADSTGVSPESLVFPDTAVGETPMTFNGGGQVGMAYAVLGGSGMETFDNIWFTERAGDSWQSPVCVAAGMGVPTNISFEEPAVAGDSGAGFFIAYTRRTESPPLRVVVRSRPDTTTLGEFDGYMPALACDWHGSLWLSCVVATDTNRYLLVRRYSGGTWSEPETLCTNTTAGGRPQLCVDRVGRIWAAYGTGFSAPPYGLSVRYFDGQWRAPEALLTGAATGQVAIAAASNGPVWVAWQEPVGNLKHIYASHRLTMPGVEETPDASRQTPHAGATFLRTVANGVLYDIRGRRVLEPGTGVYFVVDHGRTRKVIIAR